MGTHERRMAIWNTLCQRKQDTAGHLAAEFHVSLRTIYYDLEYLSLIYPLEVIRGRYHGGIKIVDYYTPDKTKLPPVQLGLMLRLCANLYGNNKFTMLSILKNPSPRGCYEPVVPKALKAQVLAAQNHTNHKDEQ